MEGKLVIPYLSLAGKDCDKSMIQTRISRLSSYFFGYCGVAHQAVTLLVAMASGKNIWRLKLWRPTGEKRNSLQKLSIIGRVVASPVFLVSPHVVQKVECVNLNELQFKMANLINLKGFCALLAMLYNLSSFVMLK